MMSLCFSPLQHSERMASHGGGPDPPNRAQSGSRLKSKKPPSLVIAIPPPEDMMAHDPARQVC